MRGSWYRFFPLAVWIASALCNSLPLEAQQDSFRWMDFHSAKDQDIILWVTRSLEAEKWSSIREIGVIYDAALVVTTLRANPEASPDADTFNLWSASLTTHAITPLLKGVNLRWLDWMQFSGMGPPELGAIYDDCTECAATSTYFTALFYDRSQHIWNAHWMRGGQAVPIWAAGTPDGVNVTRVYAILAGPDGRELVGTWNHFDYGKAKPAEDFVYRYDLDPFSHLERMLLLSGKEADAMKLRLCSFQGAGLMARGQDSVLCQQTVHGRPERRPTTTPPPNNQGRSTPPGAHPPAPHH